MPVPPGIRRQILAKIHLAKKQLGLRDDDYRDFLEGLTQKRSAGEMDLSELNTVLQAFEAKGFKVKGGEKGEGGRVKGKGVKLSPKTRDKAKKTPGDKVRALWIQCAQAGKVRDRSDEACRRFCRTITGVERIEWLTHAQARRVIQVLEKRLEGEETLER